MIRVTRFLSAGLALLLFAAPARAQDLPFEPGEHLSFELRYLWVDAGELKISVGEGTRQGIPVWPLEAAVKTHGLVNAIFSLDTRFTSFFDPVRRRSIGSDLVSDDNGDKHHDVTELADGKAFVRVDRGGKVKEWSRDVDPDSNDILSAIYRVRTLPLHPGQTADLAVFTGRKSFVMSTRVVGREKVSVGVGKFRAVLVECRTHFEGRYKSDREIRVWLSDDARRLPLKFEAPFSIATLKAELVDYRAGMLARR